MKNKIAFILWLIAATIWLTSAIWNTARVNKYEKAYMRHEEINDSVVFFAWKIGFKEGANVNCYGRAEIIKEMEKDSAYFFNEIILLK